MFSCSTENRHYIEQGTFSLSLLWVTLHSHRVVHRSLGQPCSYHLRNKRVEMISMFFFKICIYKKHHSWFLARTDLYQTSHFFLGFIGLPTGQLKAFAKLETVHGNIVNTPLGRMARIEFGALLCERSHLFHAIHSAVRDKKIVVRARIFPSR